MPSHDCVWDRLAALTPMLPASESCDQPRADARDLNSSRLRSASRHVDFHTAQTPGYAARSKSWGNALESAGVEFISVNGGSGPTSIEGYAQNLDSR